MIPFVVAVLVLIAVGVLLWKAMSAQAAQAEGGLPSEDTPTGPTRPARPRRSRPVAPDDDPEFLRSLDDRIHRPEREDPPSAS